MSELKTLGRQRRKGFQYDFFNSDWTFVCPNCKTHFDSSKRTMLGLIYKYHAKKECLGGW